MVAASLLKAVPIAVWYELSDVKLAEADDCASCRYSVGGRADAGPQQLCAVPQGAGNAQVFMAKTDQFVAKRKTMKAGTLVVARIIESVSKQDGET